MWKDDWYDYDDVGITRYRGGFGLGYKKDFSSAQYKSKIASTAEILLREANTLAQACRKKAYLHVVGLGLGLWQVFENQGDLFVEAWGDALKKIKDLHHVAYVDFSDLSCNSLYSTSNNKKLPGSNVVIRFSKQNLHDAILVPEHCVAVCNYAWSGNSLPGSEYWVSKVCSSGDHAAACSSCVSEIQERFTIPAVCDAAVRIVAQEGQLINLSDYLKVKQGEEQKRHEVKSPGTDELSEKREKTGNNVKRKCSVFSRSTKRQMERDPKPTRTSDEEVGEETAEPSNSARGDPQSKTFETRSSFLVKPNSGPLTSPHSDGLDTGFVETLDFETNSKQDDDSTESSSVSDLTMDSARADQLRAERQTKGIPKEARGATIPDSVVHNEKYGKLEDFLLTLENDAQTDSLVKEIPKEIPEQTNPDNKLSNPECEELETKLSKIVKNSKDTDSLIKDIPKEIPHPTIPDCMIPNPEYEKQRKKN